MEKAKIGIVGLGWIAQVFHLPILTKITDAAVTCVCDKDTSRAKALAEKFGIKRYYTDVRDMLQSEDLGQTILYLASLPPRACVNELIISPTWNRLVIGGLEKPKA